MLIGYIKIKNKNNQSFNLFINILFMKRIVVSFFLSLFILLNTYSSSDNEYPACSNYYKWMNENYELYKNSSSTDKNYFEYFDDYQSYYNKYIECTNSEYKKYESYFDKWLSYYKYWNYADAVENFERALIIFPTDWSAKKNIWLSYYYLAEGSFNKSNYNDAIKYYRKAEINWYWDVYSIYFNMGVSYYILWDTEEALKYYDDALEVTYDSEKIKEVKERIELVKQIEEEKEYKENLIKAAPTNDPLSWYQYYIKSLNIPNAWKKISWNWKQVIIAVIDDWVNINHPDLYGNIWTNQWEIPWDWIDNDKNWYIDDYNGWNFASDNLVNLIPSWTHWTMVAWIIWANINNNEWVTWIVKNVKIMWLRVFESDGLASSDNIVNAINYAIDNWANIINLSLWGHQWAYSKHMMI